MSALGHLVEGWEEGYLFTLEDRLTWSLVNLVRGDFVELELNRTDWEPVSKATAGFLVLSKAVTGEGGLELLVKSVGCSDPNLNKALSTRFNRRRGHLHLCLSSPCTEAEEHYLHVTAFRAFSAAGFSPTYYMPNHRRQVAKWLEASEAEEESHEASGDGPGGLEEGGDDVGAATLTGQKVGGEGGSLNIGLKPGATVPKRRVSRPSALREAGDARARGKGLSTGGENVRGERHGDGLRKRPSVTGAEGTSAVEEIGEDLQLGTRREREEMSTEELRRKLDVVRTRLGAQDLRAERCQRGGRARGGPLGQRARFRLCGGVEDVEQWVDSEEETTSGGFKRFYFERCLEHVGEAGPASSRRTFQGEGIIEEDLQRGRQERRKREDLGTAQSSVRRLEADGGERRRSPKRRRQESLVEECEEEEEEEAKEAKGIPEEKACQRGHSEHEWERPQLGGDLQRRGVQRSSIRSAIEAPIPSQPWLGAPPALSRRRRQHWTSLHWSRWIQRGRGRSQRE